MHEFQILEHIADIRLLAKGDTKEELFRAALSGMNEIIHKGEARKEGGFDVIKEINIASSDLTGLLIDFLSEILSITHTEKAIFPRVEFLEINNTNLEAKIYGRKIGEFKEDIKAVTYHEAEIKENSKGELETLIVFDI